MKIKRLMRLLLLGMIVSTVMLTSCNNDEVTPDNPDYSQDKGEFKDARDGRVYKWVKIGDQIWMAENLAYTGNGIRQITDNDEWVNNSLNDGWCYFDNNSNYAETYGVLYQWEAAKKACPDGWHLPTDDEWSKMEDYLITHGYSYDGVVGNEYIAKSLATDYSWEKSDGNGAIGNTDYPEFRNKTGFYALPGGYRYSYDGTFRLMGHLGRWWSSTGAHSSDAYCRSLSYSAAAVYHEYGSKSDGFSVRCIRD